MTEKQENKANSLEANIDETEDGTWIDNVPWPRAGGPLVIWGRDTYMAGNMHIDGYHDAASILVDHVVAKGIDDGLVPPILNMYRHFAELAIKRQIDMVYLCRGEEQTAPRTHKLDKLWKLLVELIEDDMDERGLQEMEVVECYVMELQDWDKTGTLFRYNDDSRMNQRYISLDFLQERMQELRNWFSGLFDYWENGYDEANDANTYESDY